MPASTAADVPEQRILEQSVRLPTGGAVTGWAACRLHGAGLIDGIGPDRTTALDVPLLVGRAGRGMKQGGGAILVFEPVPPDQVVERAGIPVTVIERAVIDAIRLAPDEREAVVVIDMVAAAELTSIARVRQFLETFPPRYGRARVLRCLGLADERSLSPNETRTRLVWRLDAGLPPLLGNVPVHDKATGRLLGIADLLDPVAGAEIEYDGAEHRHARRHTRDVRKETAFREHRIEVARVTGEDLRDRPLLVRRLVAARARARFQPPEERSWDIRLGPSLDERLEEAEFLATLRRDRDEMPPDPRGW